MSDDIGDSHSMILLLSRSLVYHSQLSTCVTALAAGDKSAPLSHETDVLSQRDETWS